MAVERTAIVDLLDSYVVCRTIGHSWDVIPNAEFSLELFRTSAGAMALRCTRCHAERYDYIAKDMTVQSRTYNYPPHYMGIQGEGKRPNLRGEMFKRSLVVQVYNQRRNGAKRRT
jgi:hypothetical protein